MKTITFYSYKGGTGRSLALANAARYLARLEFKVVALDFDLEAPGLHYKFSLDPVGKPLKVQAGVVDYLYAFVCDGVVPSLIKEFTVDVTVPGTEKPLIQLIPAGQGPSREYWAKLSHINWHELFYSKGGKGVQVFLDLKNKIADELKPDFLLIDSRTGITEMGGVATTLLADKVIALVLPSRENLEGTRAVLQSLIRSRRDNGASDLDVMVALSRLPQTEKGDEQNSTERIRAVLNEEAEDLRDTLGCKEVFVLHSEEALALQESLRIGSGVSPDESVLLRDYLSLFAKVVPRDLVEPKVGRLISQAREKIWEDPDAALKEVEELAESFGHPEHFHALLRFYEVRNVSGIPVLKRAQRLWEITSDSNDVALWQALRRNFDPTLRWRAAKEWFANLEFIEAVWRGAGGKEPEFGEKVAEMLYQEDHDSRAADVLLEILRTSEPNSRLVSRCVTYLDVAKRGPEAGKLIQEFKPKLAGDPVFLEAWVRHVLREPSKADIAELVKSPIKDSLVTARPYLALVTLFRGGYLDEAAEIIDRALQDLHERGPRTEREAREAAEVFQGLGRLEDFEKLFADRLPRGVLEDIRGRTSLRRRK